MPIRKRISGDQELTPVKVIEQREAAARLAARASDRRGIHDPKTDPYPNSKAELMGIEREVARAVLMCLAQTDEQHDPKDERVQDLALNLRLQNNPGDPIERTYRERIGSPLTGIRGFCVECQGGSPRAVAKCDVLSCPLWAFRTGRNRYRTK